MQILYHHQLCPLSRQVRIFLQELNIDFILTREDYWQRRPEFVQKNPACNVPVLEISDKLIIVGHYPIIEYLNDEYENFYFMPQDNITKAKVREYMHWFNDKFYREVSKILVDEKMIRLLMRVGEPRSNFIRAAKANLLQHFRFMNNKLESHSYLTSEKITCADIIAASHISVVDYFGEINWDGLETLKQWYSIIKSRPSFQTILSDRIPGFNPPKHYSNLDF
ncbi:MAG: glutathione S-transferase family protein [Acinetobacter sp.]|uniref:glutathione S-transferase family protein n=1 Tax=Acinetobacter sp. TaxID=472 RepID=UPI000FB5DEC4|nr:glutathione S-transferase family protein [Acinetobacter sp.]RUP42014.1 MAG: glutathione S-transferase family protein [Acinetobacter sp.]